MSKGYFKNEGHGQGHKIIEFGEIIKYQNMQAKSLVCTSHIIVSYSQDNFLFFQRQKDRPKLDVPIFH